MSLTPSNSLERIKERIRTRLEAMSISGNEASRKAGIGVSYINDLLQGKSKNPSTTMLERVAKALDCDLEYILGFQEEPSQDRHADAPRPSRSGSIPLYTVTMTDADGFFPMRDGEVTDFAPPTLFDGASSLYAVTIGDDLMSPRFLPGEIACANTRKPIAPGSFAVIRLNNDRAVIRQVVSVSPEAIELVAIRDKTSSTIQRSEIKAIHRITSTFEG